MNKQWIICNPEDSLSSALSRELNISRLMAQILINRGIRNAEEADIFLKPRLASLRDPMEIPGIGSAARRVLAAKDKAEKVLVYGDYDVDGVSGTAILLHALKFIGIPAEYYIPHRYDEGYGLSIDAVRKIAESGVKLIVTVDCGIASIKEIEEANRLGVEVIVTDHHNLPEKLPNACAIVNPKMIPTEHPSRHLSGAGVAFKFAWALLKVAGKKESVFLTSLLDLAALGTISDVVPLNAENRIIAAAGLALINERKRLGIKHLAGAASLNKRISIRDIYFGLAPRINAAGRLEHASKSVELFLTEDPAEAKSLAAELGRINTRRQGIGSDIKEEVFSQIDESYINDNKLVILSGQDWHPGVIGIVASQVVDRFNRPAVLIGVNGGVGRGSARSVDGINIFDLLGSCHDLFLDFGGHEGAAGFEIDPQNIPDFINRLRIAGDGKISMENLKARISIEAELPPSQISLTLIKELELLDPHGEGNPQPVFSSRDLKLADLRTVGAEGKHLKARFTDGKINLDTIGFGMGGEADKIGYNGTYDIAYKLEANEWDGFEVAQLSLVDIREAKA